MKATKEQPHPVWDFMAAALFGVVFLGGGLFASWLAYFIPLWEWWETRQWVKTPGELLLFSQFPLWFVPLGTALPALAWWRFQRLWFARSQARLHPQEPWRWKREWEPGGKVRAERDHLPLLAWLTLWPVLVAAPLVLALLVAGAGGIIVLALLPCLLACVPGWFAWRRLRTRRVIGRPILQLETLPIRPGQVLRGELQVPRRLGPLTQVKMSFFCELRHGEREGKGGRERQRERRVTLALGNARQDATNTYLPVQFSMHEDAPGTTPAILTGLKLPHLTCRWFIEVRAHSHQRPVRLAVPVFECHGA